MKVDPSNKQFVFKMLYLRGLASFNLELFRDAFDDFSECLRIDEESAKALSARGKAHAALDEHEESIIDWEESLRLCYSTEVVSSLEDAEFQMRIISKKETCFDVLGVNSKADVKDVKKALKISLRNHSAKSPNETQIERKKFDAKLQKHIAAYKSIISSKVPTKKR